MKLKICILRNREERKQAREKQAWEGREAQGGEGLQQRGGEKLSGSERRQSPPHLGLAQGHTCLLRLQRCPLTSNTVRGCAILLVLHKPEKPHKLANGCWVAPDDMWLLSLSLAAKSCPCLTSQAVWSLKWTVHVHGTMDAIGWPCMVVFMIFTQATGHLGSCKPNLLSPLPTYRMLLWLALGNFSQAFQRAWSLLSCSWILRNGQEKPLVEHNLTQHRSPVSVTSHCHGHWSQWLQVIIIKYMWWPLSLALLCSPSVLPYTILTNLHLHGSQVSGEWIEQVNSEVTRPDGRSWSTGLWGCWENTGHQLGDLDPAAHCNPQTISSTDITRCESNSSISSIN